MRRKIIRYLLITFLLGLILYIFVNIYIRTYPKKHIFETANEVPAKYTALVLGAHVSSNGTPSIVLEDRLRKALELYRNKKIKRFLLSGDHGRKNYDEVNNMKSYLLQNGVPESDIFLDHAGFDTYNSIYRAKEIFNVKEMIIVTQEFHLSRAIFIARKKEIDAVGCVADMTDTSPLKSLKVRESVANLKAFFEVLFHRNPKFLGSKIPIIGDSRLSYD